MTTVIIDGSNLFMIHRAANTAMDSGGNPCGGVLGFVRFLSKFVSASEPQRVIILFDGKNGSAKRRSIYKNYKAGRKPRTTIGRTLQFGSESSAIDNQDWQFNNLLHLLACLPVQVMIVDDAEADDAAAYFIKNRHRYSCDGDVLLVSTDKDFSQLLSDEVSIYNPINKNFVTTENFVEKYEVSHQNWLFFRSICGDASDNLDGVKGFGAKTLQKVFDIQNPELKFDTDSIRNLKSEDKKLLKLKENLDLIERNWKLMDLGNPMISFSTSEKLDYQFLNFEPALNKKDFIVRCSELGFIDQSVLPRFLSLLLSAKKAK